MTSPLETKARALARDRADLHAARLALGPWADGLVESTPATRAELVRNVAAALRAFASEVERDALERAAKAADEAADELTRMAIEFGTDEPEARRQYAAYATATRDSAKALRRRSLSEPPAEPSEKA